ncbi:class I SAM-dependent methyltransferase [Tellurirhabdus rosea]|uniref:class I SAM-dependent methyltransferase n=1 Tax=Tellurirhabdus rosea TaxID=2674997 RepID=UPI002259B10A|nr:class I SAM-dependent methyltransferase [Tellurirhabdus rosea]
MTLEFVKTCPVCGADSFTDWLTCQDNLVSGEAFTIQQCRECDFKLTNPRPTPDSIGRYYQSSEYISHSDTRKGLISQLYHSVRSITLKQKVSLIDSLQPGRGQLLDVGCGSGYFLAEAKEAGWQVSGMEPDEQARAQAIQRTGHTIAPSLPELPVKSPFDVVTLWHVLEHIHALEDTLQWFKAHIRTGGHLVIAVPNYESWDAKAYRREWAAFDVPRHLYHFAPKTLGKLLAKHGFQIQEQKPMLFDAFYVNLLSTKNRDGKPAYLESFLNGLRSNWEAYRNGGNYSSVIYIAKAV